MVLRSLPILPYDERVAWWHARERARLVSSGQPPSFVDGQIAAITKVSDLTLVTNNPGDYVRFKELRLENWHEGSDLRE